MSRPPLKALWHPSHPSYFFTLSEDCLSVFSMEGEEQGSSFDLPLARYRFRELLIGEKVVDFFFWPGDSVMAGVVLGCLTVTGDIVLLQCVVPASVSPAQRSFLGEVDKKQEIYLRQWSRIDKS